MRKSYKVELPNDFSEFGNSTSENAQLSIKRIIDIVQRRLLVIFLGFLLTFLAVAALTFSQSPTYTATTQVIVETEEKNVINIAGVTTGLGADTAVIDTEVEVMGSIALLEKVVRKNGLVENEEFNPFIREPATGFGARAKSVVKSVIGSSDEDEDPFEGLSEEEKKESIERTVVENLARNVKVSRVGTTFILMVQVDSGNPETAAMLANAIAEQYRINQLDEKLEATKIAADWLSENVEELANEVEAKQRRVEDFRARSGLLEAAGTRLTEQNLTFLEADRARIKSELDEARSKFENVQNTQATGGDVTSLAEVLDSPIIADLKSQRAAVLRRQAELLTTYGPRHPEMQRVRSEAADIDEQISSEVNRIVARLSQAVLIAERQLNEKNRQISGERNELARNNKNTVELKALERDARTSEELYEEFLSRFKETRPQNDIAEADARILSRASIPDSPSSPKTLINLILGVLLGGIVGSALALLLEMFDTRFSDGAEVHRKLGIPTISSVPQISSAGFLGMFGKNPAEFMIENPFSAYSESVRILRAAIAFSDIDKETKTVAVTSSLPDEGKTSLTLALGRMSAMSGSRTLVIDGDFRRRQLTIAAGVDPEIGFIEHLFGVGTMEEVIMRDSASNLHLLPLSLEGHTPHDVFGTRAFDDLLEKLREHYDLILIDTGPLLFMAEARVIAGKSDQSILILRWRSTTSVAARQSLNLLKSFNANILGIVLNRVDTKRRRHYKDPSTKNKAYKKYYTRQPSRLDIFRWFSRNKGPRMTSRSIDAPPAMQKETFNPVSSPMADKHNGSTAEHNLPVE